MEEKQIYHCVKEGTNFTKCSFKRNAVKVATSASTICKESSKDLTKETYQNHLNQTRKCKCIYIYIYI